MSKFKFVNILDLIFLSIATFLIIFAWLQFFLKNILISLLLSTIISLAILFLIRFIKEKKHSSIQKKMDETSNITKFTLTLQTLPSLKFNQYIKKLIPQNLNPHIQKGDVIFTKNNISTICTYSGELNENKLLEIIKTKTSNNLIIFCTDYSANTKTLSNSFKNKTIKLVKLEELYEVFNKNNIIIDTTNINLNKSKITFKEILLGAISKDKSKGYFISGLIFLFTSLIIPYHAYYVIFSTVLIGLSIICRLKPQSKISKINF